MRHFYVERGVDEMLLMVILGLLAIVCVVGAFQAIKQKNILSVAFHLAGAGVFGWFVIMTVVSSGYPATLH